MRANECNSSKSRSWPELGRANKALCGSPRPCHIPCTPLLSPALSLSCHPSLLSAQHQELSKQSHQSQLLPTHPTPHSPALRGPRGQGVSGAVCLSVCLSGLLGHPAKEPVGCYRVGILTPLTGGSRDRDRDRATNKSSAGSTRTAPGVN